MKLLISGNSPRTRSSASPPAAGLEPRETARERLIWKFSATVRSGKMPASSGEYPMPWRARSWAGRRVISRALNVIRPLFTGRRPMMLSMVVVFPAPFRPTRQTASPPPMTRDRLRSTCAGPRKVSMRSTSSIGSTGSTGGTGTVVMPRSSGARGRAEQVGRHLLVLPDLVGCPVGQDGPLVHGHDARTVPEHHVHVVLDDDGGDPPRLDDRGDDVHDGGLLAGAHAAGRLVEEEELRPQRVGDRDVEQLPLPLGEPAGQDSRLGAETQ